MPARADSSNIWKAVLSDVSSFRVAQSHTPYPYLAYGAVLFQSFETSGIGNFLTATKSWKRLRNFASSVKSNVSSAYFLPRKS